MDNWESIKITYDGKHYKMNSLKGLSVKFIEGKEFKVEINEKTDESKIQSSEKNRR